MEPQHTGIDFMKGCLTAFIPALLLWVVIIWTARRIWG